MRFVLLQSAIKLNREHKYRNVWKKVISVLSAVVVFCTTYALILPAITMGRDAACGLEDHEHGDSCYTRQAVIRLQCALEISEGSTVIHAHDSACYDSDGALWCRLPEVEAHVHSDACYEVAEIACALIEEDGHECTEECVTTQSVMVCGAAEELTHRHDETCIVASEEETTVLTCEIPEHIHEDACYPPEETESAESGYLCGSGVHTHEEHCYTEEGTLACTIPEHIHEAACLVADLDLTADVESLYDWEEALSELCLTGNWSEDVLAVAKSQLDYQESVKNVILADDRLQGYTRYGAWYGDAYGDWDAMFAAFCLYYAGVENYPLESEADLWIEALTEQGLYFTSDAYSAKPGDLIFFDYDQVEDSAVEIPVEAERVGIVVELIPAAETEPARIQTIEGDTAGQVAYVTYDVEDVTIIGYAALPEQTFYCGIEPHYHEAACADESGSLVCGQDSHVHDETCWNMEQSFAVNGRTLECGEDHAHTTDCYGDAVARFSYEDDIVSMKITVVSSTGIPRGTQLEVTDLSDESFESYFAYADENSVGELTGLVGYEFHFYLAGEEIEIEDAEITVEMAVNGSLNNFETDVVLFSTEPEEDGAEAEEEPAGTVTILSEDKGTIMVQETLDLNGVAQSTFVLRGSGGSIALAAQSAAEFTVEFYAHMPTFDTQDTVPSGKYLEVINTYNGGENKGGNLPTNQSANVRYILLTQTVNATADYEDEYELKTKEVETKIYSDDTRTYYTGMTVDDLNKIRENKHYQLDAVWVSRDNEVTWQKYTNVSSIRFTNNSNAASDSVIFIDSNTILRFEYQTVEGTYSNFANFFDYDISDAKFYRSTSTSGTAYSSVSEAIGSSSSRKIYMNTNKKGINSNNAYVGSGSTRLAFGNSNTSSGWETVTLGGYYINQANRSSFKYCSFGIVTGYDYANDRIIYANGLNYQALFNDESYYNVTVPGKTTYGGNTLDFIRNGDTYILKSVNGGDTSKNGVAVDNLDVFNNPGDSTTTYTSIYTNNFWPMDGTVSDTSTGHDMKFGSRTDYTNNLRNYIGNSNNSRLPASDDFKTHNSYFGMQYAVDFELDGEYCGPLEYLFYGDDDMWVFLTYPSDESGNRESKLICDIGGVHSSVGSYTDLWDWIPKGTEGEGKYTLTFFYTERGASGSSCYMAFTIPTVTSVPQNTTTTGSISVTKDVEGVETEESYEFKFDLSGTVDGLKDNFLYKIDNANGASASSGTIASGETFSLTDGQTITILGIPKGAKYTITEQLTNEQTGYEVTWSNGTSGNAVTGTVEGNTTHTYTVTNQALGSLEVKKSVSGISTTESFQIDVTLTDADGKPLSGTFGGYTFDENGTVTVDLTSGEVAAFTGIPAGTGFTVHEQLPDGYHVRYLLNGEAVTGEDGMAAESASGTIEYNSTVSIEVVNATTYRLPETGGSGTFLFTFGGLLMIVAACVYFVIQKGRKYWRGGMFRKSR